VIVFGALRGKISLHPFGVGQSGLAETVSSANFLSRPSPMAGVPLKNKNVVLRDAATLTDGPPFCEHVFLLGGRSPRNGVLPSSRPGEYPALTFESAEVNRIPSTAFLLLTGNMPSALVTNEPKIRYPSGHLNCWSKGRRVPARLHPAKPDQFLFLERNASREMTLSFSSYDGGLRKK